MKALVAYISQTGNTKKVAEAIYEALDCDKELKPVAEVQSLAGYDLAFLGFPVLASGPDGKAKAFLQGLPGDQKVALFITHSAPEDFEEIGDWVGRFQAAASGAQVVGAFHCQGQRVGWLRTMQSVWPKREWRLRAKDFSDVGQPDETRLSRAQAFARSMLDLVRG